MLDDQAPQGGLSSDTRILHVVTTLRGPVGEVAADAIRGHLAAGLHVAVAARRSIVRDLDLPASPRLAIIAIPARDHVQLSDADTSLTLHQHYRHVDVVHAHGLHAAALAGAGMTGLPARLRPALVATVGRFRASSVVDGASAKIVGRTAAVVLGTTEPIADHFAETVPVAERARLHTADVSRRLSPVVGRARTRENLDVPAGAFLVASPQRLVDGDELTTLLETGMTMFDHRPDRRIVLALTGTGRERSTVETSFTRRHPIVLADEGAVTDVLAAADVVIATKDMTGIDAEGIMQLGRATIVLGTERTARPWGDAAPRIDVADTAGLQHAIAALVDSPVQRTEAAFAVRRRVDDADPATLIAEDLLDVYAEALEHRR